MTSASGDKEFQNKVAIITGASSGIGQATAILFAEKGCSLTITGRNESNLAQTRSSCIAAGIAEDQILMIVGDICDAGVQKDLITKTVDKFGKIDILVNNAGLWYYGGVQDTEIDVFDILVQTNLRSMMVLSKLAVPHLISSKGCIVNVSSATGLKPFTTASFYGITKAGVDMFTKVLALELAPKGVRVNSVNPGVVETAVLEHIGFKAEESKKMLQDTTSLHPIGRIGQPREIADAIGYLASDRAGFVTGTLFSIDGGMVIAAQGTQKL